MNAAQRLRSWFRFAPASPVPEPDRASRPTWPVDEDADVAPEHDSVMVDRDDRLDRAAESDARWS